MSDILLAAIDCGNGKVAAVSNAIRGSINNPIRFEPVIAPITKKRGLDDKDRPRYTLMVDKQCYVFGVNDVFSHGKRDQARRSNNAERYGSPDYMMLLKVAMLQAFTPYRGKDEIKPTVILTIPIDQYNKPQIVADIKKSVASITRIEDQDGCLLRLNISEKRVMIIPEASGAFTHYAFDAKSMNPRGGSSTVGTTAVVDTGYLTTNIALFENAAYQRDRGLTVPRGGFNVVVRDVLEYVNSTGRDFDISRVDHGLHAAAGIAPGKKKEIDLGGGVRADVAPAYDVALEALARLIADNLLNAYKETLSRVLVGGGGTYHLERPLREFLKGIPVVTCPDPELANVFGAYTLLRQQAKKLGLDFEE